MEKFIPLPEAAKALGVDVRTLAGWIELDCHKTVPRLGPGAKRYVLASDVEHVVQKRAPRFSKS